MENQRLEEATNVIAFGKRKIRPRVCVADGKRHIRTFLVETLEDLGFIPCECAHARELGTVFDAQVPDLVVLGLSAGGIEAVEIVKTLAAKTFDGKLLLLGPRACPQVAAIQELGEKLGIAMLPVLRTPFGEGDLRDSVVTLLPTEEPPDPLSTWTKRRVRGGSNYGINRRSTRAHSHCTAPKGSFVSVIQAGESSRPHISYRTTVTRTSGSCLTM
jgi:CheY-like chemotaxis protein